MSKDQIQDVFAANFDFKKGEQPTAEKLTGWVKQTNSAFSDITKAIGDPWMYQTHGGKDLSPEELAQASLARIVGPSDWLSPHGASFNERCNVTATLKANRNSWSLGYPIVAVSQMLTPTSTISNSIVSLESVWDSVENVVFGGAGHSTYFANRKNTPEEVATIGDYYVDFYAGIITSYSIPINDIKLTIYDLYMFGAGVPWGTSNVIPSWNDDNTSVCSVIVDPDGPGTVAGETTYLITLPAVNWGSRATGVLKGEPTHGSTDSAGVTYNLPAPGADSTNAKYRLPYSLVSTFGAGADVPEGYMFIWDGTRVVPNVRFVTKDDGSGGADPYRIQAVTIENALNGLTVRIIITGTSAAEAINYLMHSSRSNTHNGLTDGQDGKTLAYNAPIAHKSLVDRFGGNIVSPDTAVSATALTFVESAYPTNEHPQYLHRAGYMINDQGNSYNVMRGDFVLGGVFDSDNNLFPVGNSKTSGPTGGLSLESYSISFGGNTHGVAHQNPHIKWAGGVDAGESWTSGHAYRIGFGLKGTGLRAFSSESIFGALTLYEHENLPLYLKGGTTSPSSRDPFDSGGTLGFDYRNQNEMHYIKMTDGSRNTYSSDDPPNVAVETDPARAVALKITPSLSRCLSYMQIREFRFRSVPYVSHAESTDFSIGDINDIDEFNYYFTSPSMIGVDFLNVYSNAIFFSATGDGTSTSFTNHGKEWLEEDGKEYPIGIYYEPEMDADGGGIRFVTAKKENEDERNTAAIFNRYGKSYIYGGTALYLLSDDHIVLGRSYVPSGSQKVNIHANEHIHTEDGDIGIAADNDIKLAANNNINLTANDNMFLAAGTIDLTGEGKVKIESSSGPIEIKAESGITIDGGYSPSGAPYGIILDLSSIPDTNSLSTLQEKEDLIDSLPDGMLYSIGNSLYIKREDI